MDTTDLAQQLMGTVLLPSDDGFDAELASFNLAFQHTPQVVVAARSASDVSAAVAWAGERGLPVGVQATGHGPVTAITEGLLISTRRMTGLVIDAENQTATLDAGVTWRQLLDVAAPHGLAGLCGSTSNVGVVGYTLGGGLPVLGRAFGFACDYVRRFEVVTADGQLHDVDARGDSDLAWALRGGKGNVGIVTSMEIDLLELSSLYGGAIFFRGEDAAELFAAYADWTQGLPEDFCSSIALLRLPPLPDIPEPLRGSFVVHLRVAYPGDEAEGARLLAPMRSVATPILEAVGTMPYVELDRIHQDPDHAMPFQESGSSLRELSPAAIETLLAHAGPGAQCPLLLVEVRHMGGRLARSDASDAMGGRDEGYCLFSVGVLMPEIAEAIPLAQRALLEAMAPHSTGRSLVNFHGRLGDDADRARPWSADNYARLQQIKGVYDPDNMLRFGHAVAPVPVS